MFSEWLRLVLIPSIEHHQSKSSSSMPSSWVMNLTARGGRSFRVCATPRAVICCRCASIHRRSSSVLMPAAWAIWSLLFAFMVGRGFDAAKIRLFFLQNNIYIYIAGRKPNETQRNPRIPTETCLSPIIPTKTYAKPMCVGQGVVPLHCDWGSDLGLWLVSLRSPLDVPYGAARNGGVGSGECGW